MTHVRAGLRLNPGWWVVLACSAAGQREDAIHIIGEPARSSSAERAAIVAPESPTPAPAPGALAPTAEVVTPAAPLAIPPAVQGPAAGAGCRAVDFLFVVDNSRSMRDEVESFVRSVPAFVAAGAPLVQVADTRFMVVDTDGRQITDLDADSGDGDSDAEDSDVCAAALGAGRRLSSEGDDCGLRTEARYAEGSQVDLSATLSCLAQVGSSGDDDARPIEALLQAVAGPPAAADGCNAGFVREDALLVVTLISDDDEDDSNDEPENWRRALLQAKAGREGAIVMLGLLGDNHLSDGLLGGPCRALAADGAERLQSFVESFEFHSLASVCALDHGPFYTEALGVVAAACQQLPSASE